MLAKTDDNPLSSLKVPPRTSLAHRLITPYDLITPERIDDFSILAALSTPRDSLCRDSYTKRFYVSGNLNAESVLHAIVPRIKALPNNRTLRVEMGDVCATNDFVESILSSLFFKDKKERATTGKQVVFFDPDDSTRIAIRHTIRSIGVRYANCMIARTDTTPWTLIIVGHMETHLEDVLSYIRAHNAVTVPELAAEISTTDGDASGRLSVLWDMGLVRKHKTDESLKKTGRPASRFFAYHPFLDYYPKFPTNLIPLKYEMDMPQKSRQQRKATQSE